MKKTAMRPKTDDLSEAVRRAARGERVVLRRGGRRVAAVVPLADLKALEELEDRLDVAEGLKRLAEWERAGRKGSSLEDLARKYGIRL